MKLYYLNPNNYGSQWFVMSDSRENAILAIIEDMKKDISMRFQKSYHEDAIEELKQRKLPAYYTLDEFEVNQVISSEIC